MTREEIIPDNALLCGYSSLTDIEEKLKAFRIINQSSLKKRVLLADETVFYSGTQEPLLRRGREITQVQVKELRKEYPPETIFRTIQPDEGIAVISDLTNQEGKTFTQEILRKVQGLYRPQDLRFFEHTNSFSELMELLKGTYFPKLAVIGFIPPDRTEMERVNFDRVRKFDSYLRFVELTHTIYKPQPYFPRIKQLVIDHLNEDVTWVRMLADITREYTKPYYVDEI